MDLLKSLLLILVIIAAAIAGLIKGDFFSENQKASEDKEYDETISFPSDRYPETAKHIQDAINEGESDVCTIDRDGAEARREQSLKDVAVKTGYDRDEWPMAMCKEGGEGASVEYIAPSDNRGAGSWVGHQLTDYPDGTKVLFTIQ
ncbi:NucA/NucB deoxyribonuclease domain-containing protein [Bacillus atrophaeus]|uniref:NucA/NucB deoxyribonuclease domain-containing protein n=1 Tax=Bacillus atrophaeus TaxID=1452 RepID=UPI002280E16B|nr:NucA/NucB deoxyribonuclease domain-containing protein [Bacillus atrophaeus]MCY8839003.1 NucA/NucB deoxyribonuclease domain-containing protein [Bacillus atrophaeus]MEC5222875.1 NucA/NucB deoxyribonuclease domain-containing protein [Bacillus atrophaeus]MED4578407.1 NucA/NucB deoxyribonuclease domain-containing protein [Bacillus atrophaeus]MED4722022.1 NucA/NucB deoxyribonuclease domain-containing protein [Bacillus atrophaeus]MED4848805.1 NucA/NucB deoxyribonuclease domain-containing protein [